MLYKNCPREPSPLSHRTVQGHRLKAGPKARSLRCWGSATVEETMIRRPNDRRRPSRPRWCDPCDSFSFFFITGVPRSHRGFSQIRQRRLSERRLVQERLCGWCAVLKANRFRAKREQLNKFQGLSLEEWLKTRLKPGFDCLNYAKSARPRRSGRCAP